VDSTHNEAPTLDAIRQARGVLGDRVRTTPVWEWRGPGLEEHMGSETDVVLKLELFQYAGSFKPRGAMLNMLALTPDEMQRGVTAMSAGNHAMAVAFAASAVGVSATVVMPHNANPFRVAASRDYGAEVRLVDDVHAAAEEVNRIVQHENRTQIHPFEGYWTTTGTATLGLEWSEQASELDAIVVPVGGGGLISGIATAFKYLQPNCRVYGVEPEGADTLHRSFVAGEPQSIDAVRTIADSLGAPYCAPYSFGLCQRFVDELVMIDDDQIREAMRLLFTDMKLAVEPAGAAATAALVGPLRDQLRGKRVGVLVCGANIDAKTFAEQIAPG